jgi:hypothetical protein
VIAAALVAVVAEEALTAGNVKRHQHALTPAAKAHSSRSSSSRQATAAVSSPTVVNLQQLLHCQMPPSPWSPQQQMAEIITASRSEH